MKKNAPSNKTSILSIRMTPERMEQLSNKADSLETTPSMLVRSWIAEKLKKGLKNDQ